MIVAKQCGSAAGLPSGVDRLLATFPHTPFHTSALHEHRLSTACLMHIVVAATYSIRLQTANDPTISTSVLSDGRISHSSGCVKQRSHTYEWSWHCP